MHNIKHLMLCSQSKHKINTDKKIN